MTKKLFSSMLVLIFCLMSTVMFCSCGSDDNDDEINSAIVGTWKLTHVKAEESNNYITWTLKDTYATFKSDGTYTGYGYYGNGSGTWTQSGNTVKTYVDGKLYITYDILSVTGTETELKMSVSDASIWIKCQKQ